MSQGLGGQCMQLPAAHGFGDVAYLCPQGGGGYGIEAAKGHGLFHLGYLRQPDDLEHITRSALARL